MTFLKSRFRVSNNPIICNPTTGSPWKGSLCEESILINNLPIVACCISKSPLSSNCTRRWHWVYTFSVASTNNWSYNVPLPLLCFILAISYIRRLIPSSHSLLSVVRVKTTFRKSSRCNTSSVGKNIFLLMSLLRKSRLFSLPCITYGCLSTSHTNDIVKLCCFSLQPRVCKSTSSLTSPKIGVWVIGKPIVTFICLIGCPLASSGIVCNVGSSIVSSQSTIAVSISFSVRFLSSHSGMYRTALLSLTVSTTIIFLSVRKFS